MNYKPLILNLKIGQYVCFFICLLLMLIVPITRSHKIIGIDLQKDNLGEENEIFTIEPDRSMVVNTTQIGKEIIGYGGPTPVKIYIKDDRITKIEILPNHETPEFLGAVKNSNLLDSYYGLTLQEAISHKVDAISGASFSSNAIIGNLQAGIAYALDPNNIPENTTPSGNLDFKWWCTLVIILCGALIPLKFKNKVYRYIQLSLNVLILGFWGGTFISYSLMVSWLTNGITTLLLLPVVIMLITAFVYPMFGKIDYYCNWLCPYGSIQEIAGKCFKKKVKISQKVAKSLQIFKEILWFVFMWLLWTGLWTDWMGYEPFAAFFFTDASIVVLCIAGTFLFLSLFLNRPYCRFVCPTGSLFKFSEGRH